MKSCKRLVKKLILVTKISKWVFDHSQFRLDSPWHGRNTRQLLIMYAWNFDLTEIGDKTLTLRITLSNYLAKVFLSKFLESSAALIILKSKLDVALALASSSASALGIEVSCVYNKKCLQTSQQRKICSSVSLWSKWESDVKGGENPNNLWDLNPWPLSCKAWALPLSYNHCTQLCITKALRLLLLLSRWPSYINISLEATVFWIK